MTLVDSWRGRGWRGRRGGRGGRQGIHADCEAGNASSTHTRATDAWRAEGEGCREEVPYCRRRGSESWARPWAAWVYLDLDGVVELAR